MAFEAEKSIAFPLRTRGRFIVDAEDQRVWLKCVNWLGLSEPIGPRA